MHTRRQTLVMLKACIQYIIHSYTIIIIIYILYIMIQCGFTKKLTTHVEFVRASKFETAVLRGANVIFAKHAMQEGSPITASSMFYHSTNHRTALQSEGWQRKGIIPLLKNSLLFRSNNSTIKQGIFQGFFY